MNINANYNIKSKIMTFDNRNKNNLSFKSKLPKKQFIRHIPDTVEILGQKYSTKETKNLRGVLSALITIFALPFSILGFFKPTDKNPEYAILEEDKQVVPKKVTFSAAQEAKLENLINEGKLDRNYVEIFKELEGYEGKDFVMKAYSLIAKSMGLAEYPDLIINTDKHGSNANSDRKITISLIDNETKEEQLGVIRHELEHYRQDIMVYRAFGREDYIDAFVQNYISKLKYCDEYCREYFDKTYPELSEEEIKNFAERVKNEVYPPSSFLKLEYMSKKMGAIQPNTEEYKEAEKYLNGHRNYLTIHMVTKNPPLTIEQIRDIKKNDPEKFKLLQDLMESNLNNELEKGAIREQKKIKEMYNLYKKVIKPLSDNE